MKTAAAACNLPVMMGCSRVAATDCSCGKNVKVREPRSSHGPGIDIPWRPPRPQRLTDPRTPQSGDVIYSAAVELLRADTPVDTVEITTEIVTKRGQILKKRKY